ncbi:hypothetical protein [Longimicrobium sp.]|uniref:hypothetical protein n=1 Tax=Longimicrobium sp. TaxID=2029185 RepID=UPI003B3A40B5
MTEPNESLSPERAAAVLKRAAQLQAEAAQRLDERSSALSVGSESSDAGPHDFTLEEVRAAALEAGIPAEFFSLAVAESGTTDEPSLSPAGDRAATRYFGVSRRTVEVARTVERPVAQVYAAMQRVLPAHPWYLALRDTTGDPLAGGILVFDVPGYGMENTTSFAYHVATVDIKQLQVMLRPVPGREGQACEIIASIGLVRSVRRNLKTSGWVTGALGTLGGFAGTGIGLGVGLAGGLLALPAVAGVAVLGGATAAGYRALYRYSLHRLGEELERLLQGVDAHARTDGAFSAPRPGGGPGDGGAAAAAVLITTIT